MNAPLTTRDQQHLFARLPEPEQQRQLTGRREERSFAYERATADEKARTIWMSIASERMYERWWGNEILEVSRQAIRAERLDSGAPILVDHSTRDQVGVIDSWEITQERKVRVLARFGKSQRAEEVWRDVLDGIRKNTSIGYIIHKAVLVEKNEDVNTYRITDWEPLEGSLVAVPADPSVGPGRALDAPQTGRSIMTTEANPAPAGSSTEPSLASGLAKANEAARADERQRIAKRNEDIIALGEQWPEHDGRELALAAISKPDMSVEAFRAQMMDVLVSRRKPTETGRVEPGMRGERGESGGAPFGAGARVMLQGAQLRAFQGLGKTLGGGKEDLEIAYRAGMWCAAVIHGDPSALRWCRDAGVQLAQGNRSQFGFAERAMVEGSFTSAGWLVPVEMEAGIIRNREEFGVARRICNVTPMNSSTTTLPRVTGDSEAYFVGEGTQNTNESQSPGDQVGLTLKDLNALTKIGKSTAQDTVISLAEFVAQEQGRAFSIKEDKCLIIGDGTSAYGGMTGIKTLLDTAGYTGGRVAAASGHDTFPEIDIADITSVIGLLPVYARPGARWLCSGVADAVVFGRLKLNAGGNDAQSVQGRIVEGSYGGFPITVAHHMPVLGTYNGATMMVLGNFNLGVAFGSGNGMMMTVDPYTLADFNLTRIISTERIDIVAHGVNKSTTVAGPIVGLHGTT